MKNSWYESTRKIFVGVVIIAFAGVFSTLYDYLSYFVNILENISEMMPSSNNELASFLTSFKATGIASELIVVAGYVFYLLGLKRFSKILPDVETSLNVMKVHTAVIMLICGFVAKALLSSIPIVGILVIVVVWVLSLVAYYNMKGAFGMLMRSPNFSLASQAGAKKLRVAAKANIWFLWLPLIALGIALVMFVMSTSLMDSRYLKSFLYICGALAVAFVLCVFILMIIAFVYQLVGWYKVMNGGPSGEALVDSPVLTPQQQPQKRILQKVESEPKKSKPIVKPLLNRLTAWIAANRKKITIVVGVAALAGLLIWLVPKFFKDSPLEFERYEQQGDTTNFSGVPAGINVFFDIPKGGGSKQENVEKAIREIISQSNLAKEVGHPIEGSLKEVAGDYVKRFLKYAATNDELGPVQCDLGIVSGYQNESSVTLHIVDGLYGNGGPQEYDYVVRLSDGHIMQQKEMIQISDNALKALIEKNLADEIPVNLDEGYCLSPTSTDSCKVIWPIGSHFNGEALIPLSDLEPFLTEEGKILFKAKPVLNVTKDIQLKGEDNTEVEESVPEEEVAVSVVAEPGRGDLGGFDLRGPVKKVVYSESSYTFNEQGQLLTENGESLKSIFPGGVKRDKNGRLTECNADGYGSRYYTYNANGLPTEIRSDDSGRVLTYDENGYVKTEKKTIEPDMGSEDAPEVINLTYTILEKDSYDNWTKRKDQNGNVESRQISYFEDIAPENVVKETTVSEKPSKPIAETEASPSQSEPKVQKKVAQPVKKVQKPERKPVQNNRKKIEEAELAPQNKGTGFHFERVDRVP